MSKSAKITGIFLLGLILWSGVIIFFALEENRSEREMVMALAMAEARGDFNMDLGYRRWVAAQGGVYVVPSDMTPPNPFLSYVPGHDVLTTDGQKLTLVDPSYMVRQVHELGDFQYGAKGHLTSLNPLRPENKPDDWERDALQQLTLGVEEVAAESRIDGEPYLRLMQPMVTEESCLKCHAQQGYRLGDIRGAISVSIPLAGYFAELNINSSVHRQISFVLWFIGLFFLSATYMSLKRHLQNEFRAKERIELSESKYRTIFDESTIGIILADWESGRIIECNQALARLVERDKSEIIGQPEALLFRREVAPGEVTDHFLIHREQSRTRKIATTLLTSSGREIEIELKGRFINLHGQKAVIGVFRDVSEQMAYEERLRQNEKKFRHLLNSQLDAVFLYRFAEDRISRIVEVNDAAISKYGYTREEFLSLTLSDISTSKAPWDDPDVNWESLALLQERTHIKKSGESFPVEVSISSLELDGEVFYLTVARDISARIALEEEHRDLLNKLKHISGQIPGAIFQFERSPEGSFSVTFISGNITDLFGLTKGETITTERLVSRTHPDDRQGLDLSVSVSAINLGRWNHEFRVVRPDGSIVWLEGNSVPIRKDDGRIVWYGFISDITDKKENELQRRSLEGQLRQKEKLEIIGLLTGGIAHNFNNNLAIILGNLELARHPDLEDEEKLDLLDSAHIAARRAGELIRQLMKFSRKEDNFETLDLNELLSETGALLRGTLPSTVDFKLAQDPGVEPLYVHANAARVQDVLLNLVTNAIHAMQERGELEVAIEKVVELPSCLNDRQKQSRGSFARITVSDTGCGISAENLGKIFDPFFTTKSSGEGTGLGLATVKSSIEQCRGCISVESEVGQGTRFYLYFPLLSQGVDFTIGGDGELCRGQEHILLVDDEPMIADMMSNMLKNLGYQATVCADGQDALSKVEEDSHVFDLIVTDQLMPGMTGGELAQRVKQLRDTIPVILITGYNTQISEQNIADFSIDAICYKPFDLEELSKVIRTLLDR